MPSCLYSNVQLPSANLTSVEVVLTFCCCNFKQTPSPRTQTYMLNWLHLLKIYFIYNLSEEELWKLKSF